MISAGLHIRKKNNTHTHTHKPTDVTYFLRWEEITALHFPSKGIFNNTTNNPDRPTSLPEVCKLDPTAGID